LQIEPFISTETKSASNAARRLIILNHQRRAQYEAQFPIVFLINTDRINAL